NGFDHIVIHFGNEIVGATASFDELRLGASWSDVSTMYTAISSRSGKQMPDKISLRQNYPNPFNPETNISYALTQSGKVRLSVYDVVGREVAVLVDGVQSAGNHSVVFSGANLPSGIYFYQLKTVTETSTIKMTLMK
ncbi:T9SS type A sorting domain-containing protein, partial [candidate division KSB1 bacterium]|nr:T9SS type A sorting domain-containing protein [candidate division KSB1 bacterium]